MTPWCSTVFHGVQHKMFSHSATGGGLLCFKAFIHFFTMKDAAEKILKHKPSNMGAFVSPD